MVFGGRSRGSGGATAALEMRAIVNTRHRCILYASRGKKTIEYKILLRRFATVAVRTDAKRMCCPDAKKRNDKIVIIITKVLCNIRTDKWRKLVVIGGSNKCVRWRHGIRACETDDDVNLNEMILFINYTISCFILRTRE